MKTQLAKEMLQDFDANTMADLARRLHAHAKTAENHYREVVRDEGLAEALDLHSDCTDFKTLALMIERFFPEPVIMDRAHEEVMEREIRESANWSNLAKHRRSVVDMACDVLCDAVGVGQDFGAGGFTLYADFQGESLGRTDKPRSHRDPILDVADACDGVHLWIARDVGGDDRTASIRIFWGQGVGNCVNDYSPSLDAVPEDIGTTRISDLREHVEFLEI